ncbi:hypothetical protein TELCIR_02447 [Teladorsagia circumcincta]|uniref:Uncharacterized protein n=1 Tax=Teladorsagia circumcincta TaxID=45464 RepID=A0A2G9UZ26_TELCI|nr:hypothetical protein TELCIR_02447 [Teladorsagia circumcincta]
MTYGVGVAQNNTDLGGGGGMNDEEYDENSSARLFERSRIKALAASDVTRITFSQLYIALLKQSISPHVTWPVQLVFVDVECGSSHLFISGCRALEELILSG